MVSLRTCSGSTADDGSHDQDGENEGHLVFAVRAASVRCLLKGSREGRYDATAEKLRGAKTVAAEGQVQAAMAAGRRVPEIENLILPQGSQYPEEGGVREYR